MLNPEPIVSSAALAASASKQGLTLVHLSAQRKHLLWDTPGGFSVSVTKDLSGCAEKWTSYAYSRR